MASKKQETFKVYRDGDPNDTREFTREDWDNLPDHKYGWKKAADEPEEVSNLKSRSANNTTEQPTAEPSKSVATEGNDGEEKQPNAVELAAKIHEAKTIQEVDALVPNGETRKTVLTAAEKRKAELSKSDSQ